MATRKKAAKKKARRTVMYSASGKKLYAVRDKTGKFKDIQRYARAHAADIKRGSGAEVKKALKKAAAAKKSAVRKVKGAVKKVTKMAGRRAASAKRTVRRVAGRVRRAVAM